MYKRFISKIRFINLPNLNSVTRALTRIYISLSHALFCIFSHTRYIKSKRSLYLNTVTRSLLDKHYAILEIVLITMSIRVARSCAITAVVTTITQNSVKHRDNTSKISNLHYTTHFAHIVFILKHFL